MVPAELGSNPMFMEKRSNRGTGGRKKCFVQKGAEGGKALKGDRMIKEEEN